MIEITDTPIDEAAVLSAVKSSCAGAVVLFLGTTREFTEVDDQRKQTARLEYECYREMALKELAELKAQAIARWHLQQVAIVHRVGVVPPAETSVAVAVSSGHRPEAFAAGRWIIDTLKQRVPIWKKENWTDGTCEWVHPDLDTKKRESSIS